ncbi:MAG: nitroreductase [Pseudomonadales bacterium]
MSDQRQIFSEIVKQRRSVRGFKKEAVERSIIESVFECAQHAPSNCNTQPWQVVVASGAKCDELREKFTNGFLEGQFSMDFPYDGQYEGVYKERQYDAANQLYSAQDISREDKQSRNEAFMRNFVFFDAPHVAFFFLPEPFGLREAADLGMYAQSVMLSLVAHGLAGCPQTALSMNAEMLRDALDVPETNKILFGVSFGYEDEEHPANKCRVGRADLGDVVRIVEK